MTLENHPEQDVAKEAAAPAADTEIPARRTVGRLFREYSDREFIFVQPGGNHGDQLIYMGAEKLARQHRVRFTSVTHSEFMMSEYHEDTIIYIHGSGGFNPIWSGNPILDLHKALKHKGIIIVGPTTYWNDLDFLKLNVFLPILQIDCERLVLFTRDRVSYNLLKSVAPPFAELLMDHDTAVSLSHIDLEPFVRSPRRRYELYAIRQDKEANGGWLRSYTSVWLDPVATAGKDFASWVQLHAGARKIVTNRLHSAICGAVLGIPTTLLPNSYFKNRAVWEYSLEQRGVQWSDDIQIDGTSKLVHRIRPARWMLSRQRVQRLVQQIHGLKLPC